FPVDVGLIYNKMIQIKPSSIQYHLDVKKSSYKKVRIIFINEQKLPKFLKYLENEKIIKFKNNKKDSQIIITYLNRNSKEYENHEEIMIEKHEEKEILKERKNFLKLNQVYRVVSVLNPIFEK